MSGLLIATAALTTIVAALGATLLRTRRRLDVELERAGNDPLTGLPNRARLLADLERAFPGVELGPHTWLLVLDLDGFKTYNEAFGRAAGDELLARLSARLELAILPHGTAYRLGGDEFGALVRGSEERVRSAEF